MPPGKTVEVQVYRDPIAPTITVLFRGGMGQSSVRGIDVAVTRSDGQVITETLEPIIA